MKKLTPNTGMASNDNGGKTPSPHPIHYHHCGGAHHHHFFYVSPHCPLHRPISQSQNHSPSCSFAAPQNPDSFASVPPNTQPNHLSTHPVDPDQLFSDVQIVEDEIVKLEEEEGDPIFVLTDEWKDFFAKSEAKRRAKKQTNC